MEKLKRAKTEDVKNILLKLNEGGKMISRQQWWNWIQPYRITINGKSLPPEICNRIYRERLVKPYRKHAGRIYLELTDKGKKFLTIGLASL